MTEAREASRLPDPVITPTDLQFIEGTPHNNPFLLESASESSTHFFENASETSTPSFRNASERSKVAVVCPSNCMCPANPYLSVSDSTYLLFVYMV